MSEASTRVMVVFTEAHQLPAVERVDYLARACDGNTDLRRQVETLLLAHEHAGDFLDSPPLRDQADSSPDAKDCGHGHALMSEATASIERVTDSDQGKSAGPSQ